MSSRSRSGHPHPVPGTASTPYERRVDVVQRTLKARADARRTLGDRVADTITNLSGSMPFLFLNGAWFAVWVLLNVGLVPGVEPFDPFPFGLLTMIVSLEAIILAIVVLISQNRAARIADLREETALQVEEISEREITKLLQLTVRLLEKQGFDLSGDAELRAMLKQTNTEELVESLEKEV